MQTVRLIVRLRTVIIVQKVITNGVVRLQTKLQNIVNRLASIQSMFQIAITKRRREKIHDDLCSQITPHFDVRCNKNENGFVNTSA